MEMDWNAETKRRIDGKLKALKPFDPYNSSLCTCPPKLTLNVYNGCGNECFYCYFSAYARGRWGYHADTWGPRKDIVENLRRDIRLISSGEDELLEPLRGFFVVVSLSSDPYPDAANVKEKDIGVTRECLRELVVGGFKVLLQTKSDLLVRDLDVLDPEATVIGMTITTDDERLAAKIELHAPPPSRRIAALAESARRGFKTICRVDPIIPRLNDDGAALDRLIGKLAGAGVGQVISSTYKKKPDNAARFEERFSRIAAATRGLYETRTTEGYHYMRRRHRVALMEMVADIARRHGLLFSCCREGIKLGTAKICDGRALLENAPNARSRAVH